MKPFLSDQTQLWLMVDPPMPIDARVFNARLKHDSLGMPLDRWLVSLESWLPESISHLRDFKPGCHLAITHTNVFRWRKWFDQRHIITRLNDCRPALAEIEVLSEPETTKPLTYRLTIACEVEFLRDAETAE